MELRKVIKLGHSQAVTFPGGMLRAIGVLPGDWVKIILAEKTIQITKLRGGSNASKANTSGPD